MAIFFVGVYSQSKNCEVSKDEEYLGTIKAKPETIGGTSLFHTLIDYINEPIRCNKLGLKVNIHIKSIKLTTFSFFLLLIRKIFQYIK